MSQPELQELINREVILGTNEKLINRLLLVNDLVLKVSDDILNSKRNIVFGANTS